MKRTALLLLPLVLAFAASSWVARAQDSPSVPPVPPGEAALRGVVEHIGPGGEISGLEVVLYSLASDGRPGVSRSTTDAGGRFSFEQITSSSDTVFLLAVRYGEIPFGQRVVFADGELEREVRIEVSDPSPQAIGLSIAETRISLEPTDSGARVRVNHRLMSAGVSVAYVEEAQRTTSAPIFSAWLPPGASDFRSDMMSLGDGLEQRNSRVHYWGPLYPGDQEIQYEYQLAAAGRIVAVEERAGLPTANLLIALAKDGSDFRPTDLAAVDDIEVDGQSFRAFAATDLAAGDSVGWSWKLPEFRSDADAISFLEATLWLELDDTNLVVNEEIDLEVSPGASLIADGDEPLFVLELPSGAELTGVSPALSAVGAEPTDLGFAVRGPLPAGPTKLAFRYRIPSDPAGLELSLRFPREVALLRLLVADTGVAIGSDRLHRRRAFRSGTRMYLHNEAFRISPDEQVRVSLEPISHTNLPDFVVVTSMGVLALLSMLAVLMPLRPGAAADARPDIEDNSTAERERIYASIRDLDHDFETGKLTEADYQQSRLVLKAEAVALLKRQQKAVSPEVNASATPGPTAAFCTQCGVQLDGAWSFCASCGAPVAAARGDG
jgi:hypothetical protein